MFIEKVSIEIALAPAGRDVLRQHSKHYAPLGLTCILGPLAINIGPSGAAHELERCGRVPPGLALPELCYDDRYA
jgi:hypothetical protein